METGADPAGRFAREAFVQDLPDHRFPIGHQSVFRRPQRYRVGFGDLCASAANSSFIAAWPSKVISCQNPHKAATASKSRPMLLVRGQFSPRASMAAKARCSDSENHEPRSPQDRFLNRSGILSKAWGPNIS